jgi:acylphosphatase
MMTVHLDIRGRVQGVGFRYSLREEAIARGLSGWVRNRRDGSVEAVIQGERAAVDSLVAWAHRGPASAQVTDVEAIEVSGEYSGFEMRPTA